MVVYKTFLEEESNQRIFQVIEAEINTIMEKICFIKID